MLGWKFKVKFYMLKTSAAASILRMGKENTAFLKYQ